MNKRNVSSNGLKTPKKTGNTLQAILKSGNSGIITSKPIRK
jgi:hypothetical protein